MTPTPPAAAPEAARAAPGIVEDPLPAQSGTAALRGRPAGRRAERERRLTVPNGLTVARLAAIPVLLWILSARLPGHDQIGAAVFFLAAATDTLDGAVARRRRQVTALGTFLDPLADKLLVIAVLLVLVGAGRIAPWVGFVIVARELLVTVLRSRARGALVSIAASRLGKLKTLAQVAMVLLAILAGPYPQLDPGVTALVGVAVAATLVSGADYVWRYREHLL